ncbi:acetate/propionate family kinase [Marinicella gelatinilytica]|uniref:acetate/propionate family kinase n=1 Tax=Marinicella gelatinilytica TaxID=2996017 RepID=UPI002261034C|nr:acetate kinase [Marinicella gelatinilytica]MCX7545807.1 acetate kinase [Marinicella gelatinilytica]
MKILVINSGSSSIKFQLLQMPAEQLLCKGMADRIGGQDSQLSYKTETANIQETLAIENHKQGLQKIVELLLDKEVGVIGDKSEITAVGHRVVQGGQLFSETTLITDRVKQEIQAFADLAPLHNPPNYEGILVSEQLFPAARQVAVFDTAFHQTIPEIANQYAIPKKLYLEYGIQVYGFHGVSHQYVSQQAIKYLALRKSKIITLHLGNGCSMTAVKDGQSIDHSMGFTPSNGLIMGSRSGDIDHGIIFHLVDKLGYDLDKVNTLLNKESGLLGLTGFRDLRDIEAQAEQGNADCRLALDMSAYRIKKYIGAYAAVMNGLDAIVFTAGIGENSRLMRALVCADMDFLGIDLDETKNAHNAEAIQEINTPSSKVKVLVIPTKEELEIARQAHKLLS